MSSITDINIVLEGSSFSLYQLFNDDVQISSPASNVLVDNSRGRVILHYPGWPSSRKQLIERIKPQAIIVVYEDDPTVITDYLENSMAKLDDGNTLMYTIGYNDNDESSKFLKNVPSLPRQLLDLNIGLNKLSAARAIRTIIDDIHCQLHPKKSCITAPLLPKKENKCIIM